jgi:hypothetical protein
MSYASERQRHLVLPSLLSHRWHLPADSGWPSEPGANPWRTSTYIADRPRQFPNILWDHAAPLTAIPVRDLRSMEDYFDRGDMPDLEADVNHLLAQLFPEPAWDDDAWAFVQECTSAADVQSSGGIGHRFDAYL